MRFCLSFDLLHSHLLVDFLLNNTKIGVRRIQVQGIVDHVQGFDTFVAFQLEDTFESTSLLVVEGVLDCFLNMLLLLFGSSNEQMSGR